MNWVEKILGPLKDDGMTARQFCDAVRNAVHITLDTKVLEEGLTPEEAVAYCGAVWQSRSEAGEMDLMHLALIELYLDQWYEEHATC